MARACRCSTAPRSTSRKSSGTRASPSRIPTPVAAAAAASRSRRSTHPARGRSAAGPEPPIPRQPATWAGCRVSTRIPRTQDSMNRPPTTRRRVPIAVPWPRPRAAFTFLALLLAVLALALLALLGPAAPAADAAVFMSEVKGAHYEANEAARVEMNRAKSRVRMKNVAGALDAMAAAVAKDSLSAEVWDERGQLQMRAGQIQDAYQSYNRAAVLAPGRATSWVRLGQVALMHMGLEEQGTTAIGYALDIDSLNATAWYTRSLYHWTRGELDLAEAAIQQSRRLETDDALAVVWY